MWTVLADRSAPAGWPLRRAAPWIALAAALALLYVPTYVDLAQGLWREDEYAHGPLILLVFAWLAWRERAVLADETAPPAPIAGTFLALLGLALYALGRSQSIAVFEVASHLPLLAGLVLLARGRAGLARLGFAIAFLFFLLPLPGFVIESTTAPLKELVSACVAAALQALGYPVSRSGVVLEVGPRELLVADACAGLNSIFALLAMASLYAHLTGGVLRARAAWLLAAVLPIAVAANVLRVAILALVAFHFGTGAAEGFVHGFAGMLVFVTALLLLLAFDRLLPRGRAPKRAAPAPRLAAARRHWRTGPLVALAALAIAGTALATPALVPVAAPAAIDLAQIVPERFGDWRIDPDAVQVAPSADVQANLDRLYGQVLTRTYVDPAGERMMLTVAYGGDQSDALKAHRQEVCYAAQGFQVRALETGRLAAGGRSIPVTRFLAVRGERSEPVTYWFTMGDRVVLGRLDRLRAQLAAGFAGRIPDGMLVRVSSISSDPRAAFAAQRAFADALLAAVGPGAAQRLAGAREE
ncbi:MAG TPA: EpsI family protein [Usitatibacter sp.]|jgi:exosortase B|nr:EpsI family protein [Usitatibacter sp.]